ncbi:MAG: hypothetical protein V2J19_11375 [Wenzhouxiangella sp.]|jgi:hypothetical protein|nr:hypothetical protein [Wenzhouxiangella sp.]
MKPTLSVTLRCMLAVALLAASVPAWTSGSAQGLSAGHSAAAPFDADPGQDEGKCHQPDQAADGTSDSRSDEHDCCDEQSGCQHESCDCACPALTLVVPPRLATAQHMPTPLGASSLPARSPRNAIDTPLRPPQA